MHRREFMRAAGIVSGLAISKPDGLFAAGTKADGWRTFELKTRVTVLQPSGATRVWVPMALISATPYQKPLGRTIQCEGGAAKAFQYKSDALGIVAAEFPAGSKPVLTVTSRVATRDWAVSVSTPGR